jgi:hypothetical protein
LKDSLSSVSFSATVALWAAVSYNVSTARFLIRAIPPEKPVNVGEKRAEDVSG